MTRSTYYIKIIVNFIFFSLNKVPREFSLAVSVVKFSFAFLSDSTRSCSKYHLSLSLSLSHTIFVFSIIILDSFSLYYLHLSILNSNFITYLSFLLFFFSLLVERNYSTSCISVFFFNVNKFKLSLY